MSRFVKDEQLTALTADVRYKRNFSSWLSLRLDADDSGEFYATVCLDSTPIGEFGWCKDAKRAVHGARKAAIETLGQLATAIGKLPHTVTDAQARALVAATKRAHRESEARCKKLRTSTTKPRPRCRS